MCLPELSCVCSSTRVQGYVVILEPGFLPGESVLATENPPLSCHLRPELHKGRGTHVSSATVEFIGNSKRHPLPRPEVLVFVSAELEQEACEFPASQSRAFW